MQAVSVAPFGMFPCFVVFAARVMISGLPMMVGRRFVMTSRLMMRRGPGFAAFAAYFFVKRTTVRISRCLAAGTASFRMLFRRTTLCRHRYLLFAITRIGCDENIHEIG